MYRLRQLRTENGYTQAEIAKIVGLQDSTVRMWELGKSEPKIKTLIILADFFGVTIDYLVGRSDK